MAFFVSLQLLTESLFCLENEILSFAPTWMDLGGIMLGEIGNTEKDKYCMISLIGGT